MMTGYSLVQGFTALLVLVVPLARGRALSFWPIPKLHSQLQQARRNSSVWMSDLEMSTIEAYLDPSLSMLEWGSGSSTSWFSQVRLLYRCLLAAFAGWKGCVHHKAHQ